MMQKMPTRLVPEERRKWSYPASQAGMVQDERLASMQIAKKQVRALVVQVSKQIRLLVWLRKNGNQTNSSCTSQAWPSGACFAGASQVAAGRKPIRPLGAAKTCHYHSAKCTI